ncbi:MAG: 2-dehydro-3-deoxygalactonokinase [Bacteroidota bacterium]
MTAKNSYKKELLLCCDWGTSNFRLYLVNQTNQKILGQLSEGRGVAALNEAWSQQIRLDRVAFFIQFLKDKINQLAEKVEVALTNIPVILSGMSSSSIGMVEIPYSALPFHLERPNLNLQKISATEIYPNDLYIFGGLRGEVDVMRGEEVQLLGLKNLLPKTEYLCLLPGSHSKHIWVENGAIRAFQTYLTGELFHLLKTHSILSNSVVSNSEIVAQMDAFKAGVSDSENGNLLNLLFSIRAKNLLSDVTNADNQAYLSGLLIGTELRALQTEKTTIVIGSSQPLSSLYETAVKTLFPNKTILMISPRELVLAIPKAHIYLFQSLN